MSSVQRQASSHDWNAGLHALLHAAPVVGCRPSNLCHQSKLPWPLVPAGASWASMCCMSRQLTSTQSRCGAAAAGSTEARLQNAAMVMEQLAGVLGGGFPGCCTPMPCRHAASPPLQLEVHLMHFLKQSALHTLLKAAEDGG